MSPTDIRERAVAGGWAVKTPGGSLVVGLVSRTQLEVWRHLSKTERDEGWTIVPVEIRELEPEKE